MIDKNMMRIILILAICGFVGCASNRNVLLVKQIESTNPVVLRMKKDKSSIFSLSYPLSFKVKKMMIETFIMRRTLIYSIMKDLVQVQQAAI